MSYDISTLDKSKNFVVEKFKYVLLFCCLIIYFEYKFFQLNKLFKIKIKKQL